jgi:hypothetical protein
MLLSGKRRLEMPKLDAEARREVMEYLRENNASPKERRTVWQWVHLGTDIHDNPCYYAFAGGAPMDLISALRFDKELDDWYASLTPEEQEEEFGDHGEPITDDELMF